MINPIYLHDIHDTNTYEPKCSSDFEENEQSTERTQEIGDFCDGNHIPVSDISHKSEHSEATECMQELLIREDIDEFQTPKIKENELNLELKPCDEIRLIKKINNNLDGNLKQGTISISEAQSITEKVLIDEDQEKKPKEVEGISSTEIKDIEITENLKEEIPLDQDQEKPSCIKVQYIDDIEQTKMEEEPTSIMNEDKAKIEETENITAKPTAGVDIPDSKQVVDKVVNQYQISERKYHFQRSLSDISKANVPPSAQFELKDGKYSLNKKMKNNIYYLANDQNVKSNDYLAKEISLERHDRLDRLQSLTTLDNPTLSRIYKIQYNNNNTEDKAEEQEVLATKAYIIIKRYKFNLKSFLTYLVPSNPTEVKLLTTIFQKAINKVKDIPCLGYIYPNLHSENIFVEEGQAIFTDYFYEDILTNESLVKKIIIKYQHPELKAIIQNDMSNVNIKQEKIIKYWEFAVCTIFMDFFCKNVGLNIFEYDQNGIEQALEVITKEVSEEFSKKVQEVIEGINEVLNAKDEVLNSKDEVLNAKDEVLNAKDEVQKPEELSIEPSNDIKEELNMDKQDILNKEDINKDDKLNEIKSPKQIKKPSLSEIYDKITPNNIQTKLNAIATNLSHVKFSSNIQDDRETKSAERLLDLKIPKKTQVSSGINKQISSNKLREITPNKRSTNSIKDKSLLGNTSPPTNLNHNHSYNSLNKITTLQSPTRISQVISANTKQVIKELPKKENNVQVQSKNSQKKTEQNRQIPGIKYSPAKTKLLNGPISPTVITVTSFDNRNLARAQYSSEIIKPNMNKTNNVKKSMDIKINLENQGISSYATNQTKRGTEVKPIIKLQELLNNTKVKSMTDKSIEPGLTKSKTMMNGKAMDLGRKSRDITPNRLIRGKSQIDISNSLSTKESFIKYCTPTSKRISTSKTKLNTCERTLDTNKSNEKSRHNHTSTITDYSPSKDTEFDLNLLGDSIINNSPNRSLRTNNRTPTPTSSKPKLTGSNNNNMVLAQLQINTRTTPKSEVYRYGQVNASSELNISDIRPHDISKLEYEKENKLSTRRLHNQKESLQIRQSKELPKIEVIHLDIQMGIHTKPTPYRLIKKCLYRLISQGKLKITKNNIIIKDPSTKDMYYIISPKNGALVYYGQINNRGQKHGHGRYYNEDEVYYGEFVADLKHGHGIYYYKNNEHYKGEWSQDCRHGEGCLYYPNNRLKLSGTWQNDYVNGNGMYYFEDGQIYEGEFKSSKFHGAGILFYENRIPAFEGTWYNGLKHGDFKLFDKEGNLLTHTNFENDKESYKHLQNRKGKFFMIQLKEVEMDEVPMTNIVETSTPKFKSKNLNDGFKFPLNNGNSAQKDNDNRILESITSLSSDKARGLLLSRDLDYYNERLLDENDDTLIPEIFNFYLNELMNDYIKFYKNDDNIRILNHYLNPKFNKVYLMNENMISLLTNHTYNHDNENWNYQNIAYMTKKYSGKGFTLFDLYDRILFLIKINDNHQQSMGDSQQQQPKQHYVLAEINCQDDEKYYFIVYRHETESLSLSSSISATLQNIKDNICHILYKYTEYEVKQRCHEYQQEDYKSYLNKIKQAEFIISKSNPIYNQDNLNNDRSKNLNSGLYVLGLLRYLISGEYSNFQGINIDNVKADIKDRIKNILC